MVKQPVSEVSKQVGVRMRSIIRETGNTLDSTVALMPQINNSSALSQYLNGLRAVSLETLTDFCKAFNITPNQLLGFGPAESGYEIDLQVIVNVIDTIDYFLKQEKVEMPEDDRFKLIKYLYENNVQKDNIIPMIKIWQVANPSIFRKTG